MQKRDDKQRFLIQQVLKAFFHWFPLLYISLPNSCATVTLKFNIRTTIVRWWWQQSMTTKTKHLAKWEPSRVSEALAETLSHLPDLLDGRSTLTPFKFYRSFLWLLEPLGVAGVLFGEENPGRRQRWAEISFLSLLASFFFEPDFMIFSYGILFLKEKAFVLRIVSFHNCILVTGVGISWVS